MRISDWSSDVCSSDLLRPQPHAMLARRAAIRLAAQGGRLAVAILVGVGGVGTAVVITGAVFARQTIELGRPHQLHRHYGALGAAAAELEAVTGFPEIGRAHV